MVPLPEKTDQERSPHCDLIGHTVRADMLERASRISGCKCSEWLTTERPFSLGAHSQAKECGARYVGSKFLEPDFTLGWRSRNGVRGDCELSKNSTAQCRLPQGDLTGQFVPDLMRRRGESLKTTQDHSAQ